MTTQALAKRPTNDKAIDTDKAIVIGTVDARKAHVERLPRALFQGQFPLGDKMIDCAVLEGEIRVLTQRGMFTSLGRHKNPHKGQASLDDRPAFLSAENLTPFITDRLRGVWSPIQFIGQGGYGGNVQFGYRAEIIPLVCSVYINAEAAGAIRHPNQKAIAQRCRQLQEAFAIKGIRDLIDDVTGFRDYQAKDELRKILAFFISPELLPWSKHFIDEFYEHMFRLWGWQYSPSKGYKPKHVAKLTAQLIYEKLPTGVLETLREKNPVDDTGNRKHKHHQFLTTDAITILDKHLAMVTMLMRISNTKAEFLKHFRRAFPPPALPATQLRLLPAEIGEQHLADLDAINT